MAARKRWRVKVHNDWVVAGCHRLSSAVIGEIAGRKFPKVSESFGRFPKVSGEIAGRNLRKVSEGFRRFPLKLPNFLANV
jgi:hypothetical protein